MLVVTLTILGESKLKVVQQSAYDYLKELEVKSAKALQNAKPEYRKRLVKVLGDIQAAQGRYVEFTNKLVALRQRVLQDEQKAAAARARGEAARPVDPLEEEQVVYPTPDQKKKLMAIKKNLDKV